MTWAMEIGFDVLPPSFDESLQVMWPHEVRQAVPVARRLPLLALIYHVHLADPGGRGEALKIAKGVLPVV